MIASLHGIVQHLGDDEMVLEVGGVGLRIAVPRSVVDDAPTIGQTYFLYTRLVVRESSLSLFGFNTPEQRELFELLMQVGGVGPRLALAILSHLSPDVLRSAVARDQPEAITRVPGIGRKTAQKIVFHLRDRIPISSEEAIIPSEIDTEVLSVLAALGYSLVEAQTALQFIPDDAPEDIEERVKSALRYFASP